MADHVDYGDVDRGVRQEPVFSAKTSGRQFEFGDHKDFTILGGGLSGQVDLMVGRNPLLSEQPDYKKASKTMIAVGGGLLEHDRARLSRHALNLVISKENELIVGRPIDGNNQVLVWRFSKSGGYSSQEVPKGEFIGSGIRKDIYNEICAIDVISGNGLIRLYISGGSRGGIGENSRIAIRVIEDPSKDYNRFMEEK